MVGRYTHAHQFKRARRELKFLRTRLGRVIRDIRRKIAGNPALGERFAELLGLAVRVRFQDHRQRGPKVYALHAPEVECIGKRCYGAGGEGMAPSSLQSNRRRCPMPQANDLSRCLTALDQDSTLIAVIEMSQSSWLVAAIVPGIERHRLRSSTPIRQRCSGCCSAGRPKRSGAAARSAGLRSALRPVATAYGWRAGCGHAGSKPR
jgi:hypothetical protein